MEQESWFEQRYKDETILKVTSNEDDDLFINGSRVGYMDQVGWGRGNAELHVSFSKDAILSALFGAVERLVCDRGYGKEIYVDIEDWRG